MNVFGGKITTYRKLAESALEKIAPFFPQTGEPWTAGVSLPGGDFPVHGVVALTERLTEQYSFLTRRWADRLVKAYGVDSFDILGTAKSKVDLGQDFGANLTEAEVNWLIHNEFARCAEDIVWRRSKLGLRLNAGEIKALDLWVVKVATMASQWKAA